MYAVNDRAVCRNCIKHMISYNPTPQITHHALGLPMTTSSKEESVTAVTSAAEAHTPKSTTGSKKEHIVAWQKDKKKIALSVRPKAVKYRL